MTLISRIFLCLGLLVLPIGKAGAEVRAVIVGVGDYLYLDADLKGPVNDVGLMADTLMLRGVGAAAITVLADDGAVLPKARSMDEAVETWRRKRPEDFGQPMLFKKA